MGKWQWWCSLVHELITAKLLDSTVDDQRFRHKRTKYQLIGFKCYEHPELERVALKRASSDFLHYPCISIKRKALDRHEDIFLDRADRDLPDHHNIGLERDAFDGHDYLPFKRANHQLCPDHELINCLSIRI